MRGPTPRPVPFSARPGETARIRTTTSLPLAGRYRHTGEPTDHRVRWRTRHPEHDDGDGEEQA
jgi:hypothetical protein